MLLTLFYSLKAKVFAVFKDLVLVSLILSLLNALDIERLAGMHFRAAC